MLEQWHVGIQKICRHEYDSLNISRKPTLTRTWLNSNNLWHTSIIIKSNNMLVGQWHARVQTTSSHMTVETFQNKGIHMTILNPKKRT